MYAKLKLKDFEKQINKQNKKKTDKPGIKRPAKNLQLMLYWKINQVLGKLSLTKSINSFRGFENLTLVDLKLWMQIKAKIGRGPQFIEQFSSLFSHNFF